MSKKKGVEKDQRPVIESNPWKLASIGDVAGLKLLVEAGKVDIDAKDEYGTPAIVWAARNGYVEAMLYCIEMGASIESEGFGGMRPLHHACNQLEHPVLVELLSREADVNSADDHGNRPLHFAAER